MKKYGSHWEWLIFFVPAVLGLILHGYLSSFNRLISDDYCSISYVQRLGLLRSIWFWYSNWSGGYSTSIVDGLLVILAKNGMPYVVPVLLVAWLLSFIWAIVLLLPAQSNKVGRLVISIALGTLALYVILLLSPNLPQSLYWWGGMRAYSVPLFLTTLYVPFYLRFRKHTFQRLGRIICFIVSFGITFFAAGFSESTTPVLVVLMAGVIVVGLWTKYLSLNSFSFHFLLAGFIGIFLGLMVMLAAPGNAVRQEYFTRAPALADILRVSINANLAFWVWLFSTWERSFGVLAIMLGGIWAGGKFESNSSNLLQTAVISAVVAILLVYGSFPPSAFGMSSPPPDRTLISPIYFFVVSILFGSFALGQWLYSRSKTSSALNSLVLIGLAFFLGTTTWTNVVSLYSTQTIYIQYAQQWDERDAYIRAEKEKGREKVRVSAMQNWAGLDEPRNRPRYWLNVCMSDYYGIQVLGPSVDQP